MAANTVEATLISKYEDRISKGIEQTKAVMQHTMAQVNSAMGAASASFSGAIASMNTALDSLRGGALNAFQSAEGGFKKFSLAIVVGALVATQALINLAGAIASALIDIAKRSSEVTELKFAFEGLAQSSQWAADTFSRLKKATEGLVASTDLLKNANRVMQSGIKVSDRQFVELTSNIFKLAKASGVDGAAAIQAMTDALIKGNARSLAAVGLHLNVKDAVSEAALAMGLQANQLATTAQRTAFYNELIEKTAVMVARLPPDFLSAADAVQKAQKAWDDWTLSIGEGINRSKVLQELLNRMTQQLDGFAAKEKNITAIAVATNQFVLAFLRGTHTALELLSEVWPLLEWIWKAAKTVWQVLMGITNLAQIAFGAVATGIFELFSHLPGKLGEYFAGVAKIAREKLAGVIKDFHNNWNLPRVWDDFGAGEKKLKDLADKAKRLAEDLAKFAPEAMKGAAGAKLMAEATGTAAVNQQKLNEQLKAHQQLMREYTQAFSPILGIYDDYFRKLKQIDADVVASEQQKHNFRLALARETAEKLIKIEQDKNNKVVEDLLESIKLPQAIQDASSDVRTLKLPNPPPSEQQNLGTDPAHVALNNAEMQRRQEWQRIQEQVRASNDRNTPDWAKPMRDMHLEMEKLNQIQMDPFHQTFAAMKSSVVDFAGQAGQAFANFFSDLVSGQEGAGKKLLAAFIGMVGQMLVKNGVMLIQVGLAEMALASTLVGRMMGASHAAGAHAVAVGAIQAAIGGALVGAASAMAQTNTAGAAGTSFQQSVPRPISSSQVQVIQVGAAGRAQNSGEVQTTQPKDLGTLTIKLEKGLIVQEVKSNIQSNGVLRPVIQSI